MTLSFAANLQYNHVPMSLSTHEPDTLFSELSHISNPPQFAACFAAHSTRPDFTLKKGNTLFYEGDHVTNFYLVKKGFLKLSRATDEGRESIVYLYGPGSLPGMGVLMSKTLTYTNTAEALTDCQIAVIDFDRFITILSQNPLYMVELLRAYAQRLRYAERRLEIFVLTNVTARIAHFFYESSMRYGVTRQNKLMFPLKLSHQRIADFVGSYRETVTISMKKLIKERAIIYDRGDITISDLAKLESISRRGL